MSAPIEFDRIAGVSIPRNKQASVVGDDNLHVLDNLIHLAQTVS